MFGLGRLFNRDPKTCGDGGNCISKHTCVHVACLSGSVSIMKGREKCRSAGNHRTLPAYGLCEALGDPRSLQLSLCV